MEVEALYPQCPLSSALRALDYMNKLVCSTGDQTWHLNVYLPRDKALAPKTLGDEMDCELVKCPFLFPSPLNTQIWPRRWPC